jgi:hypothetical protein
MPTFNATNPVSVGLATKKDHYDRAFDNGLVVREGGIAMTGQAAQDVVIATSATQLGRVALGVPLEVLRVNESGTALEFGEGARAPYKDPVWVGRTMFGGPF